MATDLTEYNLIAAYDDIEVAVGTGSGWLTFRVNGQDNEVEPAEGS